MEDWGGVHVRIGAGAAGRRGPYRGDGVPPVSGHTTERARVSGTFGGGTCRERRARLAARGTGVSACGTGGARDGARGRSGSWPAGGAPMQHVPAALAHPGVTEVTGVHFCDNRG